MEAVIFRRAEAREEIGAHAGNLGFVEALEAGRDPPDRLVVQYLLDSSAAGMGVPIKVVEDIENRGGTDYAL